MARVKVTLEGPEGEGLPWYLTEFDVRTQTLYGSGTQPGHATYFYTPEQWAWKQRETEADKYLYDAGLHRFQLRGSLARKVSEDPVEFVNMLRRFEGLEEI